MRLGVARCAIELHRQWLSPVSGKGPRVSGIDLRGQFCLRRMLRRFCPAAWFMAALLRVLSQLVLPVLRLRLAGVRPGLLT